jgi:stearoyl-CoA desaturase (delta-9 desaturase)
MTLYAQSQRPTTKLDPERLNIATKLRAYRIATNVTDVYGTAEKKPTWSRAIRERTVSLLAHTSICCSRLRTTISSTQLPKWNTCTMTGSTECSTSALARPVATQPVRVYWHYAANLVLVHLFACLAFVPWFFSWTGAVLCLLGLYFFGTLGINLCLHRMLTHQSFRVPKWLEYTLATIANCCLEDSPARWVAIHRLHHQHSDEQADPHSPLVNLFWGHMGWIVVRSTQHDITYHYERYCRDILRDPYYFWCERKLHWLWIYVAHAILFYFVGLGIGWAATGSIWGGVQFGASLLVWGVFLRTVLVWHITWSVNSFGHVFGYQNYPTGDSSRNNVLFALISNGDGWHNNHHAHPRCAAHGHKWWEFDVTWITVRILQRLGLATNVVLHPLDKSEPPTG